MKDLDFYAGSFTLQSEDGHGTIAVLTLPMPREVTHPSPEFEPPVQRTEVIEQSASQTVQADTGVQVLLVDDHAMIRQGLRSVLETYSDICVVGKRAMAWKRLPKQTDCARRSS